MTTKTIKKPVFKKLVRFDADKAAKGVPHHIVDENGNDYGTWISSLYDVHNKYFKVEFARFEREHADDELAKGKFGGVYAFVQIFLQGWSGVLDANDNEIPFSKELAYDHLTDENNEWLVAELMDRSRDVRNYRAISPAATKEADAGN